MRGGTLRLNGRKKPSFERAPGADTSLEPMRVRVAVEAWPALIDCALASDDDHLIKLIDSCRQQERAYGGAVWREAASRAVASA